MGRKLVNYQQIQIGLTLDFLFETRSAGIGKNSVKVSRYSWVKATYILTYVSGFRNMSSLF